MVRFDDIYYEVDSHIVDKGFYDRDLEGKKELIDEELKRYTISKIKRLSPKAISEEDLANLTAEELVSVLASYIPKEEHHQTLNHFVHYVLQISSFFQRCAITWWEEKDDSLIDSPVIEFDNGLWVNLKTHKESDYTKIFSTAYGIFNCWFTKDDPKLLMLQPDDKK